MALLSHVHETTPTTDVTTEKQRKTRPCETPEHVDEGLARFKYEFPDGSVYNLNMFPLRKNYTRKLLHEVGFQTIKTYGDFQETYHQEDPDFFIHVAEKRYSDEYDEE